MAIFNAFKPGTMYRQDYLFQISRYFAYFETHLFYENSGGKFDINKESESFIKPILDFIFDADFARLEIEQENHPGIDLGDKTKKIAFQITSQTGFGKIKKTLEKIIKHKLFDQYDEFYHLVIDRKYKTEKTQQDVDDYIAKTLEDNGLPAGTSISFQLDTNLWNLKKLRAKIEQYCSTEKLKKIVAHLKENYGPVTDLPTFKDVLVPYRLTFEKQLDRTLQNGSYQFHNNFFGREDILEDLQKFADNPTQQLAILTASGGTGKTRSCIEFFEKKIDTDDTKIAFTLNSMNYDIGKFREALKTDKQIFVLVDDADRSIPIVSSVVEQVKRLANVKLIFTARDWTYAELVNSIPSHLKEHKRVSLDRLGYEETKAMLMSQLPGVDEQFIIGLAKKSNGVPLVILALSGLVRQGVPIDNLTEIDAFANHVKLVSDQAINQCNESTHLDKAIIAKIIAVLSFLGPVGNTEEEMVVLSTLAAVSLDDIMVILENLRKEGFLGEFEHQYAIKPDPYSDAILLANATRIKVWLRSQGLEPFKYRIMKNIMQVSDSANSTFDITQLFDEFVGYLTELAKHKEYKELVAGLDTIESFTYKKPEMATFATGKILESLPKNDEESDLEFWFTVKKIRDVHQKLGDILGISILNSHGETKLQKNLDQIISLYQDDKEAKTLTRPFRYRIFDFYEFGYHPHAICERQLFLVEQLKKMAAGGPLADESQKIILSFSKGLLSTEFAVEEFFEAQTGKFSYGMAEVPKNKTIKFIRNSVLQMLTSHFEKFSLANQKKILDILIHKVSHIRKDFPRNGHFFDESDELKELLPFISAQIATNKFPQERGKLIRHLQISESFGIKEILAPDIEELKKKLFASSGLEDRLKTFLNFDNRVMEREMGAEVAELLALSGKSEAFFELIENVRKTSDQFESQNLQSLLHELIANHSPLAAELLDHVISKDLERPEFYSILSKAMYKDKEKFKQYVEYFWNKGDQTARAASVWMLSSGRERQMELYEHSDLDYFDSVINDKNIQAIRTLSYNLPEFLSLDAPKVLDMVYRITGVEVNYNDNGMLLRRIFDKENTEGIDPEALKDFLFQKTDLLTLDHDFDPAIRYLKENFGFDEVIGLMVKKFDLASKNYGSPASYIGYYYPGSEATEKERIDRFIKIISRFLGEDIHVYKELIKLFRPYDGFSKMLKESLTTFEATLGNDKTKVSAMMEMVKVMEFVNSTYLEFIAEIGNQMESTMGATKDEMEAIFPSGFLYNTGSKSKSVAALAYPEDLQRQEILTKLLAEKQLEPQMKAIVENILKRVELTIKKTRVETRERLQQH